MKIRFHTTMDDLVAFNRFHLENSPAMRRQRMIFALLVPVLLGALWFLMLTVESDRPDPAGFGFMKSISFGIMGLMISIAWFFFSRWYWLVMAGRNVRRLYAEGNNRTVLGWREMELAGDRLLLKTELIESSIDLRAIDKIVGDGNYTFVYVASLQAYLIPMNVYPEEEYRQFVAELRAAWDNHSVPIMEGPAPQHDPGITENPRGRTR